jgi:hypothetical protein
MRVGSTCINVGKDIRQWHEVHTVIKGSMHKNIGTYIQFSEVQLPREVLEKW